MPTADGYHLAIDPDRVVERAASVGRALYRTSLDALAGVPLRSILGLDFWPARRKRRPSALPLRSMPVAPSSRADPRLVVAGAIAALVMDASDPTALVAQARILLGQLPHVAPLDGASVPLDALDDNAWRDAIVLGAVLRRPGRSALRRQAL